MTELERLLNGYWDGTLTATERQRLFELLGEHAMEANGESYRDYIGLLQQGSAEENRQDADFQEQWQELRARLGMQEPIALYPRRRWYRWGYAAATVLVIVAGWCWIRSSGDKKEPVPTLLAQEVVYANSHSYLLDSVLPDGSAVRLYPGATLRFATNFNSAGRDIRMDGRILFTVKNDPAKPFTVYAKGFSTTVLGTAFEVNTDKAELFRVKLITGKVVVKSTEGKLNPMTDVYLVQGEMLTYDLQKKKPLIDNGNLKQPDRIVKKQRPAAAAELSFSDIPLSILFKQLESEYGIIIQCDVPSIGDKLYTGAFRKTDDPKNILKQVIKPYHLNLRVDANLFIIEQP
ncbi:FecR domain-containing protein [Puia dinghuensis]|uniref:FecR family protein n=1 Tax=Puia dinghuensis TaxID=1792502 RepID=A0A8J2UJ37_9BACT|nr:FecR domain-containing protein [Puia dinghuensis]GGB25614.1 hypothetical protein GCM10011511_56950 [Puia dinghuensis]